MPPAKRLPRVSRYSPPSTHNIQNSDYGENHKNNDMAPKHIPLPNIPHDNELLFEAMTFVFSVLAILLQLMNIYRTIWWLPNANVNYSVHFYLIDPHLICFIIVLMSRYLLFALGSEILKHVLTPKMYAQSFTGLRMFVLGVLLGALAWCFYFISKKHSTLHLFYLCYPAVIYFILFGFQISPLLELIESEKPVLHNCSSNPQAIRAEVEFMREDFNTRMKKIMFASVISAYYTSFIPCAFAQSFVRYDWRWTAQQTGIAWATLASRLSCYVLSPNYIDTLHRAALHLMPYYTGAPVGAKWKTSHARFYVVFKNPSTLLCFLLTMLLASIFLELVIIFYTEYWHNLISMAIFLLSNYYTLFKLVRDYLVTWKVYKAESLIQEKNNINPIT